MTTFNPVSFHRDTSSPTRNVSLLTVNADSRADILIALDKYTMTVIYKARLTGQPIKRILPAKFSTDNKLAVAIFDDDQQFNAAILDGVKAEVFNIDSGQL